MGVWSVIMGLKTVIMMFDLVRFYPDVFVGGFRVDWYQVWKNKEAKKGFAGLTLTYGKFFHLAEIQKTHILMSDQQIFS